MYDTSLGPTPVQIHDMNPSILPSGLFWTIAIPSDDIHVRLGKGVASMEATDVPITDYGCGQIHPQRCANGVDSVSGRFHVCL